MFIAQVANYFGYGNTRTDYEDGSWSRNVLSCRLTKYRVRIIQHREILSGRLKPGGFVHTYLETVWSTYRRQKRPRKLDEVIQMLAIAELPSQLLETQLIQIFVVMENLKYTYARAKKYPFIEGFFRKISSPPKPNPKKEPVLGFERLLGETLSDVSMKPNLNRVIDLRNEIVHSGLSRKPPRTLIRTYEICQDIVREYWLRLLGYDGEYLIYSQACRASKKLPHIR